MPNLNVFVIIQHNLHLKQKKLFFYTNFYTDFVLHQCISLVHEFFLYQNFFTPIFFSNKHNWNEWCENGIKNDVKKTKISYKKWRKKTKFGIKNDVKKTKISHKKCCTKTKIWYTKWCKNKQLVKKWCKKQKLGMKKWCKTIWCNKN